MPNPDQRMSVNRRALLGRLLADIEEAEGLSPREVVLILRAMCFCVAKHETDGDTLTALTRPLKASADEIEEWSPAGGPAPPDG